MTTVAPNAINIEQTKECLIDAMKAKLMPMVLGSPAIGKSSVVKQIAEEFKLKLIDIRLSQCDPCDLLGFPNIDKETGKASYVPMDMFPLEGDKIPDGYNGWLIFFDEANGADRAVQKAWYKTVLDRQIGNADIHESVAMVSAGNHDTDGALVEEMSSALDSRMIHFNMAVDNKAWLKWAMANGIDHRITSYLQFKPKNLYTFNPNSTDKAYASPRTWEFANRFLSQRDIRDHTLRINLIGTLGEGVAREFVNYCAIYKDLPTIADIIRNPTGTTVPTEPGTMYALTGSIGHNADDTNIDNLMPYIQRMPMEFQVVTLREAIQRTPTIMDSTAVGKWIAKNQSELWD